MDSNSSDEMRNRLREEALARRMGEALDRLAPDTMPGKSSEICPDAEQIAAYHERALSSEEAAHCEAHFAACSRCRRILAVLNASSEAPLGEMEVARLGRSVAAQATGSQSATREDRRVSRLDWRVRWLAPALGVAAALAAWFALRPPWRVLEPQPEQHSSGSLVAQGPQNEPLGATAPSSAAQMAAAANGKGPQAETQASSAASKTHAAANATSGERQTRPSPEAAAALKLLAPSPAARTQAAGGKPDDKKELAELNSAAAASAVPPSATASAATPLLRSPSAPPLASAGAPAPAPAAPEQSNNQAVAATEAGASGRAAQLSAGAEGAASNLSLNGRAFHPAVRLQAAAPPAIGIKAPSGVIEIKTPSGTVVWRVGRNGRIERTESGSNGWISQASPSQEEWLAGAAVSESVCWIAGRNGAIARTVDGQHWEKIAAPAISSGAAGKLPDWIAIMATDAQKATIISSQQRRFMTLDGGQTWQAQ